MPVPYFFQNLAEAEYVVTLYQYMRLLGYPAEKISMLTTYNGQKALLKDVVERRCAHHPASGVPHKVSTCPIDTFSHLLAHVGATHQGMGSSAFLFPCGFTASTDCPIGSIYLPQNLLEAVHLVAQSAN